MSTEHDNVAVLHCWFEDIWNQKHPERIAELAVGDFIAHGMGADGGALSGVEAFRQAYDYFVAAFPDLHVTVEKTVACDDHVTALIRCEGTHSGELLGVPASGLRSTFSVMTLVRFHEGKLAEGWNVLDFSPVVLKANPARQLPGAVSLDK